MLLEYGNTVIGNGTVSNMTLYVGQNYYFIMSYFTITSQNRDAAQTFLSTFMKGAVINNYNEFMVVISMTFGSNTD